MISYNYLKNYWMIISQGLQVGLPVKILFYFDGKSFLVLMWVYGNIIL